MPRHDLEERGHTLEEEFFRKHNAKLREEMRVKRARECTMEELSAASGIGDEAVLGRLSDLGITVDKLAAFSLVPLVQVAWADGTLDADEREALLRAASEQGVTEGSPAYALLTSMLEEAPAASLFESWESYARSIAKGLDARHLGSMRDDVLERTRQVASASGGFLGLGKISDTERRVLERIEAAFAT